MNNTQNINQIEYINQILENQADHNKGADVNTRAAGFSVADNHDPNDFQNPKKAAVSESTNSPKLWEPACEAFLDQHIFLSKDADLQDTYTFINEQLTNLSEGYQNYRVFAEECKTVGYFLDETREGCYRIQCFKFEGNLGVNCTRLNGDSLAVCSLWSQLKQKLHEDNYYTDKFLAEAAETEDEDIFGPEDDDLDLDSFKYLDFARDEAFVSKMVEDILDVNVGTHALMLLKFNFQNEKNLQIVTDKFAQKLFDNTTERLSEGNVPLPVAVCAAHILTKMVAQAAITVTVEQISNILEAAEQWCFENNPSKTIVPTASQEAAFLLTDLIPRALELSGDIDENNVREHIQDIQNRTDFDTIRDATEAILLAEN